MNTSNLLGRAGLAALACAALAPFAFRAAAEIAPSKLPSPSADAAPLGGGLQTAMFAGGCFWGVEGVFEHVKGVKSAVAGYAGGKAATAHYDQVSTGETGHAESVKVIYDPREVSYATLLRVFFSVALDPTEVNRQGPDTGTQYRSVIWAVTPAQMSSAERYIAQLDRAHVYPRPVATKVAMAPAFYPAEAHHQGFLRKNPDNPYIANVDMPKVGALQKLFPDLWRADAIRTAGL